MAGDLIPPASPAGKPFRSRFGFVWGALLGLALCAGAALVILVTAPGESGPRLAANWSPWEPDSSAMLDGAQQIADHVGLQYRLDGGEQLVSVRASELELSGDELGVAVRPQGSDLQFLEGDGLIFFLNGLGPNGRLPTGTPSKERGRLLRREALELALYSFRYLDDATMVAVLMPQTAEQAEANAGGAATQPQTNAIFYRPGDLLAELQVPLAETLSPKTPRPNSMAKAEAARVDSVTLRNLFLASVQPLEAEQSYLVLVEPDTID
ncbi:MAG TPA: hypothetical protein VNO82_05740 [Solirubrobacteraceae bacterium]|nr:hypothetical protein [Solirubrobacteraceae bacterium]